MCVGVGCFRNEFSELTGASSPQTSPGLCDGVNGRGKFMHCHPQTLNWIEHFCTYFLYPLSITLELSDLQLFGCFEQWMFAFRKGLIAWMGFSVSKLRGTLWKEAVYYKIKITYKSITYKETSFLLLTLLHKTLIWALNLCAPKTNKIMSNEL